jgi:hypothetical protein
MIVWESLESQGVNVYRAKVPGGWLVFVVHTLESCGLTFYPDPYHEWDGTSLTG